MTLARDTGSSPIEVQVAVEGRLDEAVVRRLLLACGARPGMVRGKEGRGYVLTRVRGYNESARYGELWFVLVDLDRDGCAPALVAEALPEPADGMCFRVAVREVEAWLLADRTGFARWAGVRASLIPDDVEAIARPKERLVAIVRESRWRERREAIVPHPDSGRSAGPAYTSVLTDFVATDWDVETAARRAPSLARAIRCLRAKIAAPPSS